MIIIGKGLTSTFSINHQTTFQFQVHLHKFTSDYLRPFYSFDSYNLFLHKVCESSIFWLLHLMRAQLRAFQINVRDSPRDFFLISEQESTWYLLINVASYFSKKYFNFSHSLTVRIASIFFFTPLENHWSFHSCFWFTCIAIIANTYTF